MTGPDIKLRHLRAFLEVARQRSVGKAADSLSVSQPAVTKTLRELEAMLGVRLFEREGRGIRITRFGEVFLQHAGTSVTALKRGIDAISQALQSEGPPVRVGALPTTAARIMPAAVARYLEAGAGSRLKIVSGENAVLLEQLRLGDLDLVVGRLAAPERMTGLSFEHLYSERVVLAVRAGHPLLAGDRLDFERIARFTVLMPTRQSVIRPFVDRLLLAHGIAALPGEIETVSEPFGRAFLLATDAIWIISQGVVARDVAEGTMALLPFETADTRGAVGLTTRAGSEVSPPLAILMQTIRETAAKAGI